MFDGTRTMISKKLRASSLDYSYRTAGKREPRSSPSLDELDQEYRTPPECMSGTEDEEDHVEPGARKTATAWAHKPASAACGARHELRFLHLAAVVILFLPRLRLSLARGAASWLQCREWGKAAIFRALLPG